MKALHPLGATGVLQRFAWVGAVALLAAGAALAADSPARKTFAEAFELLRAGDARAASARFESGLKLDPNNALAYFYLAEAYNARNEPERARKAYYQSLAIDPNSEVAAQAQQRASVLAGSATMVAKPSTGTWSPRPQIAAPLPTASADVEPTVAAAAAASLPVPNAPDGGRDAVTESLEGNRSYDAGNWSTAEIHYKAAIKIDADAPRLWGRLCHTQVMQGHFSDAAETCQTASHLAPREATGFQNVGYSLSRLGKHADAVIWFQRAIEAAPEWLPAYSGIAAAQFALRDWAKAEEWYKQVVARSPKDSTAWQALAFAVGEQARVSDAIGYYRKAIDLDGANAESYRGLGFQLYLQGNLEDAEKALTEASRLDPKDASTFVTLGAAMERLGKPTEALAAWRRASELDPSGETGSIARKSLADRGQ